MNLSLSNELAKPYIDDFFQRWLEVRILAIHKAGNNNDEKKGESSLALELRLLRRHLVRGHDQAELKKNKELLLKIIFEDSRKIAFNFSDFVDLAFEPQDIQELLSKSNIPCAQGKWEIRNQDRVLIRKGCSHNMSYADVNICDYWREAFAGLVAGLGAHQRLIRQACFPQGDEACEDIFTKDAS